MFSNHIGVSFRLILISVIFFANTNARYVTPEAYNNAVRFLNDLAISASEPQPVLVPVISDTQSDTLLSVASEKVEKVDKILQRPIAFSYNNDQHQASSQVVHAPLEQQVPQTRVDQQPDAVDYYKYLTRLENVEKEGGGGSEDQKDNADASKGNLGVDSKDNVDIRLPKISNGPNFLLDYSPSLFSEDKYALHESKHRPVGFHKNEDNKEQNAEGSKTTDIILDQHEARPTILISEPSHQSEVKENHPEESHAEHSDSAGHESQDEGTHATVQAEADSHESGSHAEESHEAKEDGETSASEHGGGGSGNYKKGGGKEHHTEHHGIHDEKGEKVYDGKHQHVDVDQGHHDKEGHDDHYTEAGNHKEGEHDEDEYHAEHEHGEEGKRGANFHEDGEHSKGHSTSGEHNIHKKDEYEKKQEFYDESHEGGENEKHGEYFHEDDFQKGGHKKSEHEHGSNHKDHFGSDKHYEKGGHHHVDVGHDDGEGQDKHHDHFEKGGQQVDKHGQKKWQFSEGHGNGDNDKHDSEGHGSKIEEVPKAIDGQDSEGHGTSHAEQGTVQTLQVAESKGVQSGLEGLHAAESKAEAEQNYGGLLDSHHGGYTHGSGDQAQLNAAESGELQAGESTNLRPIHTEKDQAKQLIHKGQGHDHGAAGDEKHRYMLVIVDDNNANGKLEGNA